MNASKIAFHGVTPYLHYDNATAMIEWLTRVFGFTERGRWLDAQRNVCNAELYAGDTEIWLDGDPEWWKQKGRRPEEWLGVWVDDVDAMYERVKAAGVSVEPPQSRFFGVRV